MTHILFPTVTFTPLLLADLVPCAASLPAGNAAGTDPATANPLGAATPPLCSSLWKPPASAGTAPHPQGTEEGTDWVPIALAASAVTLLAGGIGYFLLTRNRPVESAPPARPLTPTLRILNSQDVRLSVDVHDSGLVELHVVDKATGASTVLKNDGDFFLQGSRTYTYRTEGGYHLEVNAPGAKPEIIPLRTSAAVEEPLLNLEFTETVRGSPVRYLVEEIPVIDTAAKTMIDIPVISRTAQTVVDVALPEWFRTVTSKTTAYLESRFSGVETARTGGETLPWPTVFREMARLVYECWAANSAALDESGLPAPQYIESGIKTYYEELGVRGDVKSLRTLSDLMASDLAYSRTSSELPPMDDITPVETTIPRISLKEMTKAAELPKIKTEILPKVKIP